MFRLIPKRLILSPAVLLNKHHSVKPVIPRLTNLILRPTTSLILQRLQHTSTHTKIPPPTKPNTITTTTTTTRPTKAQLLASATSLSERLLIHLKWPLLRTNRPFTLDEISAFISWILLSHVLWIILGTTTFVSLLVYSINWVTDSEFTSMLFNQLFSGRIIEGFEVYVHGSFKPDWENGLLKLTRVEVSSDKFDVKLNVDLIKFNLSFKKWQDMKGIIDNLQITGLRGTINQDKLQNLQIDQQLQLNNLKIKDSTIQILKDDHKPVVMSIYSSNFPKLRQRTLTLDILNGSIDGSINHDSLFTIHQKQHNLAYVGDIEDDLSPWKRITRIRLDKIDLDAVNMINSEANQQFNWLSEGTMDLTADVLIPTENEQESDHGGDYGYEESKYLVMDMKLQFHDLKTNTQSPTPYTANPPLMKLNTEEIISLDNLKPIISYINQLKARQQILPTLSFRVVKPLRELQNDGHHHLLDLISLEIYIELIKIVKDHEFNEKMESLKNWSKTVASQLLIVGIGAMA